VESREKFSWSRVLVAGSRAFAINLMLVLALHILPPIAFLCPLGTGFVTGWNLCATWVEGTLIGLVMGGWLLLVCWLVALGFLVAGVGGSAGMGASDMLAVSLMASFIVAHLVIFAAAGAILGGHFARREQAAASSVGA